MSTVASPDPSTLQTYPGLNRQRPVSAVVLWFAVVIMLAIVIGLGVFSGWVFLQRTQRLYQGHIYPHVYALGMDLGGMTPQQAVTALEPVVAQLEQGTLILTDDTRSWTYTWDDIGLHVDARAIALAAFNVGRDGTDKALASIWLDYHDVAPRYEMDPVTTQALLEALSAEISHPVEPATLKLDRGKVVVIPGKPGQLLDIDAALMELQGIDEIVQDVEIPLTYKTVQPESPDPDAVQAKVDPWLARSIQIDTYDVLTDQAFTWTIDGEIIASWLYLLPGSGTTPHLAVNPDRVMDTLQGFAQEMGAGRGFRFDEAVDDVLTTLENGTSQLDLYLTHPERSYTVQAGDTLTRIAANFGVPAGLVAEANPDINVNQLSIDQEIIIPSQDILTPHMPIPNKRIEVSLGEQRVRVYENGELLWDWITSTGIASSPTNRGVFQVLEKDENAYASQWELWMPYFIAVYDAGGGVTNGFHELPILASGARLWAGTLGQPASFGCIILGIPEAETLYTWADPGVTVVIE